MTTGKRIGLTAGVVILIVLAVLAWKIFIPGPLAFADGNRVALGAFDGQVSGVPADFPDTDPLARGKYLAEAADCEACHTAEGGQLNAGGRPFATDFGTLYSPNITPDPETGIGTWTDEDFIRAMHQGVSKDGKNLYPAFPYAAYTYLTEEDVLAIKEYLFSLPPVKNVAPENTLRSPYDNRSLMAIWSRLYNPNERFRPVASQTVEWNRGAYLVEALGHCGDCHTPRSMLQALDNRKKFAGGVAEGWRAYNLTSDKDSGIGAWTPGELFEYLKTGHSQNRGSALGPMAQAVHLSFQKLTSSDLNAIIAYVRSVPAISSRDLPAPKLEPASDHPASHAAADSNPRGHNLFAANCAGCHNWTGVNDYVPYTTLTGSRSVNDPTATNVALSILKGATTLPPSGKGEIATMPSFGALFTDDEVADVANYVIARFGAKPSSITGGEVTRLRAIH